MCSSIRGKSTIIATRGADIMPVKLVQLNADNPSIQIPIDVEPRKQSLRLCGRFFAADDEHVYSWGIVKDVDGKNFRSLIDMEVRLGTPAFEYSFFFTYAGNEHCVLYRSQWSGPKKIKTKSPNQFKSLGYLYVADDQQVFYDGVQIKTADAKTFERLSQDYARDEQFCFYKRFKIVGAKRDTFRQFKVLNQDNEEIAISTDGERVFYGEQLVPSVSAEHFSVVKDDDSCFIGFSDGTRLWTQAELYEASRPEGRKLVVSTTSYQGDILVDQLLQPEKVQEAGSDLVLYLQL
jgi:DKNYY family